ncbi:MAG: pilus assembly PilX N-terminal domain-containing protein [Gammaproteobacteria bacterium]|nr:pilus assembly PilX N-terminal domain-containing protein [Gammaproteobacteria bacterium]
MKTLVTRKFQTTRHGRRFHTMPHKQAGMALIIGLVLTTSATLLGVSSMMNSTQEHRASQNFVESAEQMAQAIGDAAAANTEGRGQDPAPNNGEATPQDRLDTAGGVAADAKSSTKADSQAAKAANKQAKKAAKNGSAEQAQAYADQAAAAAESAAQAAAAAKQAAEDAKAAAEELGTEAATDAAKTAEKNAKKAQKNASAAAKSASKAQKAANRA